jgi:uncharacterized protein (TIGR02186 family)
LLTIASLLLSAALQAALSTPVAAAQDSEPPTSIRIDRSEIPVNMFFRGATVHVEATIPAGFDAAILCAGEEHAVELKRKGKVLGLLWMSVGDAVFEDVPSVYLLSTTRPLSELAPTPALEALGLGYPALQARALGSPEAIERDADFAEFLKLKESENLYSYDDQGVKLGPGPSGEIRVSADCLLPTKVPWGEYPVRLFGFEEGKGKLLRSERLHVTPVGVTDRISTLARNHGLLYGIFAVVIALAVGLLTGLAFGLGSKKGD